MVIRLESYEVNKKPSANTGAEKIGQAISYAGQTVGRAITSGGEAAEREKLARAKQIQQEDRNEAKKQEAEQKAAQEDQEARDRIIAADKMGGVQREYVRRVKDIENNWVGSKTSPEYEKRKKAEFDQLLADNSLNLSKKVQNEMRKTGKNWLNSQLLSDLNKAYKEEVEAADAAAQNFASDSLGTGAELGEAGDIEGGAAAFAMTRQTLKDYADKAAEDSEIPMKEFDGNYMLSFLTGAAKNNPDTAWELSKPENIAWFMQRDYEKDPEYFNEMSKNLQKHIEKPMEYGRNKLALEQKKVENETKVKESLDFMNNPIIMGSNLETVKKTNPWGDVSTFKDFYDMNKGDDNNADTAQVKRYKEIAQKEKDQTLKTGEVPFDELQAYNKWKESGGDKGMTDLTNDLGIAEDDAAIAFKKVDTLKKAGKSEEEALDMVFKEFGEGRIKSDVNAKEFGEKVRTIDLLKNITPAEAQDYIDKGYNKTDIIKAQAEKLYENSGKVGDGSISNKDLHSIIKQVSAITIDENGDVDDNLIKAFMARNHIQDANASPEQINTFNNLVQKALTDGAFKEQITRLANKPRFDTMFAQTKGTSKVSGIGGFFRSAQDDANSYVENVGRDAYVGAMAYLASGDAQGAMDYYDSKVRQAYDFLKSDIIDTDYVNKVLSGGGKPIVPVNGEMTEIVGRDPNGEYILRSTGRVVNGNI